MARTLLLAALVLALAGCNRGHQQAAGDNAVAANSADAVSNDAAP